MITKFFKNIVNKFNNLTKIQKIMGLIALIALIIVIYNYKTEICTGWNNLLIQVGLKGEENYQEVNTEENNPTVENVGQIENFAVKGKGKQLVLFYAPWCPHCKDMLPEWDKFAEANRSNVEAKKVNSEEQPALIKEYDVQGFPTILLLDPNGKTIATYEGGRDAKSFADFVNRQ
tara:strand:+ start:553 stop:1077 length:525 start_codon:yes stop_codon:yes gene_type:complete